MATTVLVKCPEREGLKFYFKGGESWPPGLTKREVSEKTLAAIVEDKRQVLTVVAIGEEAIAAYEEAQRKVQQAVAATKKRAAAAPGPGRPLVPAKKDEK